MILELPKKFRKDYDHGSYVIVRGGKLEIHGRCENFEELMKELTFLIRGKEICYYCGKHISKKQLTIDHRYPQSYGGVTITNNLTPACLDCNGDKGSMNENEYAIFTSLERGEQNQYLTRTIQRKDAKKYSRKIKNGFNLPKEWLTICDLHSIQAKSSINNMGSKKFKKMLYFATQYGRLPRPIVISSNNVLLDGKTAYHVAKKLQFNKVPVIKLKNVTYFDH